MSKESNFSSSPLETVECLRDATRARARRISDELYSDFEISPNVVRQEEFLMALANVFIVVDEVSYEPTEEYSEVLSIEVEVSFSLMSSPLSVVLGSSTDISTCSWLSMNSTISIDVDDCPPDEDYDADISSCIDDDCV